MKCPGSKTVIVSRDTRGGQYLSRCKVCNTLIPSSVGWERAGHITRLDDHEGNLAHSEWIADVTQEPFDIREQFEVKCWADKHNGDWVVIRLRDRKVMTQGGVTQCLRWVNVWGPTRQ